MKSKSAKRTQTTTQLSVFKQFLKQSDLKSWFDIGILFDQLRDNRPDHPTMPLKPNEWKKDFARGTAFVNFDYGIDGVSVEVAKYSKALEKLLGQKKTKIWWVAETFKEESRALRNKNWKTFRLDGGGGFWDWEEYEEFFHQKLDRGSSAYNNLANRTWISVQKLANTLARFVLEKDIRLLVPVNVASNPGNISLTMALILVSEKLQIPVLNNCHDFWWESGKATWEKSTQEAGGIRDHFFTNAHLGEVFSPIEISFPWDSPLWFHTVLNQTQKSALISRFGINPRCIAVLPTSVDTALFAPRDEEQRYEILERLQRLLSGGSRTLKTTAAKHWKRFPGNWNTAAKPIFLGHQDGIRAELAEKNILFLQPTRILKRKGIRRGFALMENLLTLPSFSAFMDTGTGTTMTLLVTGPVTKEHLPYLQDLVRSFRELLDRLPKHYRDRVFLAFRFGLESNRSFEKKGLQPLAIHEIYGASNLVLLPSKQEGRGLPIIESSACGVPIMSTRYEPEEVFSEVIGENLDRSLRLDVLEFPHHGSFPQSTLEKIANHFSDPHFESESQIHNRRVVKKRFSQSSLENALEKSLDSLQKNNLPPRKLFAAVDAVFEETKNATSFNKVFHKLVLCENRKYLPGLTPLEYMIELKSLIDPSSFRMEEKRQRGMIFSHASFLLENFGSPDVISPQKRSIFLDQVEAMFCRYRGEDSLVQDHALSYRHRHRRHYPWRKHTSSELRGVLSSLFLKLCDSPPPYLQKEPQVSNLFQDMRGALQALIGSRHIVIDDIASLLKDLKSSRPVAWFPGGTFTTEAIILVQRTLHQRLGIPSGTRLTEKLLTKYDPEKTGPVTLFVRENFSGRTVSRLDVKNWLTNTASSEIRLLYKYGFFRIVVTKITSQGIHLAQLGKKAAAALNLIRCENGFIFSVGDTNMLTLDMVNLPSYRLGKCSNSRFAAYMGLKKGESYALHVPAGLRPSLAFPTPIQTPLEFSNALKSDLFTQCKKKFGNKGLLELLKEDADRFGSPVHQVLKRLLHTKKKTGKKSALDFSLLTGLHPDGDPWSGAIALLSPKSPWKFSTAFAKSGGETVLALLEQYERRKGEKVSVAWNGGYILNPELVGKLGISEKYIGTPLGLLMKKGRVLSLPLFNKPALAFLKNGKVEIREANLQSGLGVQTRDSNEVFFDPSSENRCTAATPAFFNLLCKRETIPAKGVDLVRTAGDRILEVIRDSKKPVSILPTGLTFTFPTGSLPQGWVPGARLKFRIPAWRDVENAIEAGPRLVTGGKLHIAMEEGGWNTELSIKTQAARIDFTNMRGPKIGVGLTTTGKLLIAAINGRIRESVGATHDELARILLNQGVVEVMGFDPGGSATLICEGKQLNISPYNKDYLKHPISHFAEARFVGNAILAVLEK